MKVNINDQKERLEVILSFPDSRLIDLEMALYLAANPRGWKLERTDENIEHTFYRITSDHTFLATLHITHGLEPPTKAIFENKPPGESSYWPASRQSLLTVVEVFLEECAARGLVSRPKKEITVTQLTKHSANLEVTTNG